MYLLDAESEIYDGPTLHDTDAGFTARFAVGWFVTSAAGNRVQVEASASPRFGGYERRADQKNAFQVMVGAAFPFR